MIIQNGRDTLLTDNSGTLPNMETAILDYFQPMTFTTIVKTITAYSVVETPTNVDFKGVWQPLTPEQLMIRPWGQRGWPTFILHSDTTLQLSIDDVVTYKSVQYRVRARADFKLYGYMYYEIEQDYSGSGP